MIAMRAAEFTITLHRLEVTVGSPSDDRGVLGLDDTVPPGPLSTRVRVRIEPEGIDPERLRELSSGQNATSGNGRHPTRGARHG